MLQSYNATLNTSFNMWKSTDIKWLDVDISASCNAGCIDCNRFLYNTKTDQYELNSLHSAMNKLFDVKHFEPIIKQFSDLKYLQLLGNVGDPMVHPHIDKFIEIGHKHHPNAQLEINSNGSVGSLKVWEKVSALGKLLGEKLLLVFSLDGLEDTNHIYRRGCDWNRIMERAKMFIDAGGYAEWKMIDFPYNKDQREEAKALAKEMGFKEFTVFPRQTPTKEFDDKIEKQSKNPVSKKFIPIEDVSPTDVDHQSMVDHYANDENFAITPKCASQDKGTWPNFQINVEGTIWPCCFASNLPFVGEPVSSHWKKLEQKYIDMYGEHWNNLYHNKLDDILSTEWFTTDLPDTWSKPKEAMFMCLENCGTCRDRPERIQEQLNA